MVSWYCSFKEELTIKTENGNGKDHIEIQLIANYERTKSVMFEIQIKIRKQ